MTRHLDLLTLLDRPLNTHSTTDGTLSRRQLFEFGASAVGSALAADAGYAAVLPRILETRTRHDSLCGGAITVSAVYNSHFDGACQRCMMQFTEPGVYQISFRPPREGSEARATSFEVAHAGGNAMTFTKRYLAGDVESSNEGECHDYLASLRGHTQGSTQVELEF